MGETVARATPAAGRWRRAIGKLRGRTPDELRERAAQAASAFLERRGLSSRTREPSDAELWSRLRPGALGAAAPSAEALLAHFRARGAPRFFGGFDDREATLAALRRRWPEAEARVVARANAIVRGRFDLLGARDLSFGDPIDWQRDPVAGVRAPDVHWSRVRYLDPAVVGDHKLVWELNRHQYLVTLGQAYWYTGDEAYADVFVRHLTSWMGANPPERGVNWASSLELAFRAIAWTWALHFFRRSPALTPAVFRRALGMLYAHGRHVERYLSTYFSPNTHLTGEALGLFYLGVCFPELADAGRWRRTGWDVLAEQLGRQIRPDGVYFEQATYYQRYTADFYLHALALGEANGLAVRERVAPRLTAALDHLMHLTRPDGRTPLIGDDDGGRLMPLDDRAANDFRAALATAAVLFDRADYAAVAGGPAEETLWLLGPAALARFDALPARPPAATSRAFPSGGVFVMRDGWGPDANYAVIDCGPHGTLNCGHAHADALALELAADGRAVLVDPGTFTYTTDARERDRFRATASHNTVTVDGESSSVPSGPFAWRHVARTSLRAWVEHPRFDYFEGSHDGFARLAAPATHTRSVLFLKGEYWVVRDRVESAGRHRAAAHFHCAPGTAAASDARGVLVREAAGGRVLLRIASFAPGGAFACEDGWVSPAYGERRPAPVCRFEAEGTGPQEIITILLPARAAADARAEEVPAERGRAFVVAAGAAFDTVLLSAGEPVAALGVESDASLVWVRRARAGGAVLEWVLLGGRELTVDGAVVARSAAPARYVLGRCGDDGVLVEIDGAIVASPGEAAPAAERDIGGSAVVQSR